MLDTRSDAADELITEGYVSDELLANRLALLANELTHERNEAEAQRDTAIKQRDAALARAAAVELALMNMTARAQGAYDDDDLWFGACAIEAQLQRSVAVMPHEVHGRGLAVQS